MSNAANKLIQAAAGNAGESVYVDDVFSTYLWTGDDAEPRTIQNGIDFAGEGGLAWIKNRSAGTSNDNHAWYSTDIGGSAGYLRGNTTDSLMATGGQQPLQFNSNGFTMPVKSYYDRLNDSGYTFASWSFRKQEKFFDVVKYTGTGSARDIAHNLGSVPGMVIIKSLDRTYKWIVSHRSLADLSEYLSLNENSAKSTDANVFGSSSDSHTATTFHVGTDSYGNQNGDEYIAYLFAHDEQEFGTDSDEAIIKCGTYAGNSGSQTIDVGFETQWVLIKNVTSASTDWFLVDTARGMADTSAVDAYLIRANESDAEQTSGAGGARICARSTGFGFLTESNLSCNRSGETYIYMAIRRPHKPASEFAATDLFALAGNTYSTSDPSFVSGFPVDMALSDGPSMGWDKDIATRLTGTKRQETNKDSAEGNQPAYKWDYMNGYMSGTNGSTYGWQWRRAPGFLDVVCYTGNGSGTHNVSHNLGVKPELVICKSRSTGGTGYNWATITDTSVSSAATLFLNTSSSNAGGNSSGMFTDTTVNVGSTAGLASLYGSNPVNASSVTYIMYLFATVPGISKVGTYTGTTNDVNVDCGFSSGARFILVKRTDGVGDWYLWDSVRGIVSGNDPYILLNSATAEVTNTDYVDPLASGFTVTSSAPAALNASGGTYLFYAIA